MTENYSGEELTEVDMEVDDSVGTRYCLKCPCGKFLQSSCDRNGVISLTDCPRSGRHEFVYYNPLTGRRYQQSIFHPSVEQETTCEIAAVCTYLQITLPLKDLLVIPKGWTLEVQDDSDYRTYLDLDMEMQLHRIPDLVAYQQWEQERKTEKKREQREEDIVRLRAQLKELTGKEE